MFLRRLGFIGISIVLTFLYTSCSEGKDCDKAKTYAEQAFKLNYETYNLIKKEQLYKNAIELCPSYAEAHNNLGDVYERQGRFEEAISQYKKSKGFKAI